MSVGSRVVDLAHILLSFIRQLDKLFLLFLLFETTIFLLGFGESFLFSSLQLLSSCVLLEFCRTTNKVDDVGNSVGDNNQTKRYNNGPSSVNFDIHFWCSIREDEDSDNQRTVESLVGQYVCVDAGCLEGLNCDHVQNVGVTSHEDEHVLQEDERAGNGKSQQNSSNNSAQEEVGCVTHSDFCLFVNFKKQGVEALLSLFNLEDLEASEHKGNQTNRQDDIDDENDVTDQQRCLSSRSAVVTLNDFHDCEEGQVEVDHHVESNVYVELELNQGCLYPLFKAVWAGVELRHHEHKDVRYDDYEQDNDVKEETLSKSADGEPIVLVVQVEKVVVEAGVERSIVEDN